MITDKKFTSEQFHTYLRELGQRVSIEAKADVNITQDMAMMGSGDAYLFKISQGSKIETHSIVHLHSGHVETIRVMGF